MYLGDIDMVEHKFNKKIIISLITLGLAAVVIASAYVTAGFKLQSSAAQDFERNNGCLSLSTSKAATIFTLKSPKYLPSGYSFQCGQTNGEETILVYSNKTLDRRTFSAARSDVEVSTGGVIRMVVMEHRTLSGESHPFANATKMIIDEAREINQHNPALKTRVIDINGTKAWAYEATPNGGLQKVTFPDGKIATRTFDVPATLVMYEQGRETMIEGKVSVSELVKIAKSLE
jgi:hypothetical protein